MQTGDPFQDFVINLAASLAFKVIEKTARHLQRKALGNPEQQALRRVYRQAFEDMLLATARELDEDNQKLLDNIMQGFVDSEGVAEYLVDLAIVKEEPPLEELREAFVVLYDPDTLAVGSDDLLKALMEALEVAISDEASRDGSPLTNHLVVRSLSGLYDEVRRARDDIVSRIEEDGEKTRHVLTTEFNEGLAEIRQILFDIKRGDQLAPARFNALVGSMLRPYLENLHSSAGKSGLLHILDLHANDPNYRGQRLTIDQVYTPLDTQSPTPREREELARIPRDAKPQIIGFIKRSAMEAADHYASLVVLGDPGSGKSTFVSFLALCLTGHLLEPEEEWLVQLQKQGWRQPALLPVYVTLKDFAQDMGPEEIHGTTQSLLEHIESEICKCGCPAAVMEAVRTTMNEGRALLILDGLDEVPEESRIAVRNAVVDIHSSFKRCRLIVTCRILGYAHQDGQIPGVDTVTLEPFDDDKIQHFIQAWYMASLAVGNIDADTARVRIADLNIAIKDPALRDMPGNPMLLTVMSVVHSHKGTLPREAARLYHECTKILMLEWRKDKAKRLVKELKLPDESHFYRILWHIAYDAHEKQGDREGAADIPKGEVLEIVAEDHLTEGSSNEKYHRAELFCNYVEQHAGLLIGRGGKDGKRRVYSFPHRTFQEYLAGCHLAAGMNFAGLLSEKARAGVQWREVVLFAAGHMYFNKDEHHQPFFAVQYMLNDADWQAVALAGRILGQIGVSAVKQHRELGTQLLPLAQERLVALVSEGHLEPVERAEAGRTLSDLVDTRHGVGVRGDLPDIVWLPVRGTEAFEMKDEDDKVIGIFPVPDFEIAKYPITFVQFQAFINAPDGWHNAQWWEGLAADIDHRGAPGEQYFKFNNNPRDDVSWYDAVAFCRWLSVKLSKPVRLPAEWEWQWAATGGDNREYPYPGAFDASKGNTSKTGIGQTSAVGIFPQGEAWCGALDMSGNVWEWCLNEYGSPRNTSEAGSARRVVRGGSWLSLALDARAAFRDGDDPDYRYGLQGFRVVCAAPILLSESGI